MKTSTTRERVQNTKGAAKSAKAGAVTTGRSRGTVTSKKAQPTLQGKAVASVAPQAPIKAPLKKGPADGAKIVPVSKRALEDEEDRRLARKVARGDQRAWHTLYTRWAEDLRRFGASQGWERDLVDDLVQETLIRAWSKRKDYNPKYPYRVWVLTIFRRLAMTQYRRTKTHAKTVGAPRDRSGDGPWWAERDTTMGSAIEQIDARSAIAPVLAKLKPSDQKLLAAWSNSVSQRDLADQMGINPVTLRTKIMRAKMRLRDAFSKEYPDAASGGWEEYATIGI